MKFFLFLLPLFFLTGCRQYYLSVCQQWVDAEYLASTHVATPDPRQEHPPLGQMLILSWRLPREILKKKPELVLDLIFWNYTTRQVRIPIKKQMDFSTFRLLDEEYEKTEGLLTYKAEIVLENGEVFRTFKHQLWVNLITIQDTPTDVEKAYRN